MKVKINLTFTIVIDSITQTQLNSWNDAVKALDGVEVFLSTLAA